MQVTITNLTTGQIFLSTHYVTLGAAGSTTASVVVTRSLSDLDRDTQLKALVIAGSVSLAFAKTAADAVEIGYEKLPVYTNITRPAANTMTDGTMIWNSDDLAPNFSSLSNRWFDAVGNIT